MRRLCKVLEVHPSGFYAWRLNPESRRTKEEKRPVFPRGALFWEVNRTPVKAPGPTVMRAGPGPR